MSRILAADQAGQARVADAAGPLGTVAAYRRFFLPAGRRLAALLLPRLLPGSRPGPRRRRGAVLPEAARLAATRSSGPGSALSSASSATSSYSASCGVDRLSGRGVGHGRRPRRPSPGAPGSARRTPPAPEPGRLLRLAWARWAARPPDSRSATRWASCLYCGSRSFRLASTGVAMQIEEYVPESMPTNSTSARSCSSPVPSKVTADHEDRGDRQQRDQRGVDGPDQSLVQGQVGRLAVGAPAGGEQARGILPDLVEDDHRVVQRVAEDRQQPDHRRRAHLEPGQRVDADRDHDVVDSATNAATAIFHSNAIDR